MAKINYIILATPRTGSNNIVNFLKLHPSINSKGEILFHKDYAFDKKIRRIQRTFSSNRKIAGFKLMTSHIDITRLKHYLLNDRHIDRLKIIRMFRGSLSDQLVSYALANKSNIWQLNNRNKPRFNAIENIIIQPNDIDYALKLLNVAETELDMFCSDLGLCPIHKVAYEVSLLEKGKKDLLIFLGASLNRVKTFSNQTAKFNTENLYRKIISNYDEIKKHADEIAYTHKNTAINSISPEPSR